MSSIFVLVEDSDAEGEEKNLSAFSAYVSGGKRSHQHNGIVLSRPILRRILVILGVKQRYAHQLTETLYHILCAGQQEGSQHKDYPCTSPSEAPMRQILPDTIKLPRIIQMSDLLMLLVTSVPEVSRSMVSVPMIMACSRTPIVFLFGGTSGSGKTTLASLTATHFGISSVVTVDSVRDVLRGIADQQRQCPQLMASTYEAYKYTAVKSTREGRCTSTVGEHYGMTGNSSSSDNSFTSCVIEGFTRQSCCVLSTLEDAVLSMIQKGPHSVVVEGVNLLVPWMYDFHCRLEGMGILCLPFVVHLSNPKKHLQRFAVRSKHMQLLPHANKYAKNFDSVRIIQKYFLSEAQKYKVPTIANSNIDRSLAFVHYCLTTSLQVVLSGKPLTNKGLSCFTIPLPSEGMKAYANEVRERIAAKQHTTSRWNSAPPRASTSTKCGAPDSRVPEMRTTHQVGASEFLMVQSQRELSAVDDSHTGSIDVRDDESIVLGS